MTSLISLRQFKCTACEGKGGQSYHLWHAKVPDANPESKCYTCRKMCEPVPRGLEEGVKICHFACACGNEFVVRCKMSNTAPCYACVDRKKVSPHSFEKLREIDRKTDNTHNCSECNGKGNCPNMKRQPEESEKLPRVQSEIPQCDEPKTPRDKRSGG